MVCYLVLVALDLAVLFLLAIVSFFAMGLRHLSDAVEALQALIVLKQSAMSKDLYEWAEK
jgi:hypothetical protein